MKGKKYYFIYYETYEGDGGYLILDGYGSPLDVLEKFLQEMEDKGFVKVNILVKQFNLIGEET